MHAPWTPSNTILPRDGEPVEFFLDNRETAMSGVYVRQAFRSRWTDYEVGRVRTWRNAEVASNGGAQCCA